MLNGVEQIPHKVSKGGPCEVSSLGLHKLLQGGELPFSFQGILDATCIPVTVNVMKQ